MNKYEYFTHYEKPQNPQDEFEWRFGENSSVKAERTNFELREVIGTGEQYWAFLGVTGNSNDGSVFSYSFTIPYAGDQPIDATYTMQDGLTCSHGRNFGAPNGTIGMEFIQAESATLRLRLNPNTGTTEGEFSALFKSNEVRAQPVGTFRLSVSK